MQKQRNFLWVAASFFVLSVLSVPLALFAQYGAGSSENRPPYVAPMRAVLMPPTTTYTVDATDPDDDPLTYAWEGNISCGIFSGSKGPIATWTHPEGALPSGCRHEDGTDHVGTIKVHVSDGMHSVLCSYNGSESGTGPTCLTNVPAYHPGIFSGLMGIVDEICYFFQLWLWFPLLALMLYGGWWFRESHVFVQEDSEDPCVKEKAAERTARAKMEAAQHAFDDIDKAKQAADDAARKADAADKGAKNAKDAAGGRWSASGSTDWEGKHIELHREGWQDKELGKKADEATQKAKDARENADRTKSNFDAQGGNVAWGSAKDALAKAKAEWEKADAALKLCLHKPKPQLEPKKPEPPQAPPVTPPTTSPEPPKIAHTPPPQDSTPPHVCYDV